MNATKEYFAKERVHTDQGSLSELELLDAAKAGDSWAFSELLRRHSGQVYGIIYRITKNQEDAEDALQSALLNAFKNLQQFDSRARFSTWLTKIAINSALMLLRKRRRCHEVSIFRTGNEEKTSFEWDFEDISVPDPEIACINEEMEAFLLLAVQRLPAGYRRVTLLQLSGDRSITEIADLAGITTAATKSRMSRARKLLRSKMLQARNTAAVPQDPLRAPAKLLQDSGLDFVRDLVVTDVH